MHRARRLVLAPAVAVGLGLAAAEPATAQTHSLARSVVAGGAVRALLGTDGVHATVGQPAVGRMTAFVGGAPAAKARLGFWVGGGGGTATDASDLREAVPLLTALHPNAPNPFRGRTEVRFSLARDGQVRIPVYDVAGRRVATIVEGHRAAGRYAVRFDARGLPAGVYFYRLETDGVVQTRRFLLLK